MLYWQKESAALVVIFTLVFATLVFGGMLAHVSEDVYLRVGAGWCVVAAALLAVRAIANKRRCRRLQGALCNHCGYEFVDDDESMCPDCGAQRDTHAETNHRDRTHV